MKHIIVVFLSFIILFLSGCSSISLNTIQQQQLKQYIQYSNNIILFELEKDQNKKDRLQPYKSRYRLIKPIIQKIQNKNNSYNN